MSFPDRSWMYRRFLDDGTLSLEFRNGVEHFISCAIKHPEFMNGLDEIRCPCKKCGNRPFKKFDDVKLHLVQKGFLPNYHVWNRHGEQDGSSSRKMYVIISSRHVLVCIRYIMSENRKRPSPSSPARSRKKSIVPKWLLKVQSQEQQRSGESDSTPQDVIVENECTNSNSPTARAAAPTFQTSAPTTTPIDPITTPNIQTTTSNVRAATRAAAPTFQTSAPTGPTTTPTDPLTTPNIQTTTSNVRAASRTIQTAPNGPTTPTTRTSAPNGLTTTPTIRTSAPNGPTTPIVRTSAANGPQSSTSADAVDSSSQKRLTIWVEEKTICPSSAASKILRECFELDLESKGYKIKNVSNRTQEFYWKEFQKRCQWEEAIDSLVQFAYRSFMKKTYKNLVYGLKQKKERQAFMSEDVYRSWSAYWRSEEAKEISKKAQLSRRGGTENGIMSHHTSGSLSMREHRARLTRLLGRPVTAFELFVYTHTREHDGETWVDERSRTINETVTATQERLQEVVGQVVDEQRVFYNIVGGFNNRSRFYGLGDGSGYYVSQPQSQDLPFSTSSTILQMPQMNEQVTRLEHDMQSLIADQQANQSRFEGVESRLQSVLDLVRDLRSEMELLRMDITSSTD